MKITAIIAEYNPFHNGHLYHLTRAKAETNADYTLVIMSGSATQRGDFAVLKKEERARHAIEGGADLVLELPFVNAVNGAEFFAEGAIKMLKLLPDVTLSFGSESGDISVLARCAELLSRESEDFKAEIKRQLSAGLSYPSARGKAFGLLYPDLADVINNPNNILGIEYIKAAKRLKADIKFHTVKREDNYLSEELEGEYASATAVRNAFFTGNIVGLYRYLPQFAAKDFVNSKYNAAGLDSIVLYKLRSMSAESIGALYDVNEGLNNRIKEAAERCTTYNELIWAVKTKRYTLAKIKRIMLYALTDLTKQKAKELLSCPAYYKVLEIKKGKEALLSVIANNSPCLVYKTKDIEGMPPDVQRSLRFNTLADTILGLLL